MRFFDANLLVLQFSFFLTFSESKFINGMCSPGKSDDNPAQASSVGKIEHSLHRTKLLKVDPDKIANGFRSEF